MNRHALRNLGVLCAFVLPVRLFGWGEEPHVAITRAAVATLAPWQQELLGEELVPLQESYCLIPDRVYTDKANARFAIRDDRPGEVYLRTLHLPAGQEETYGTLRHFLDQAVRAVREKRIGDAARYLGTVCHLVEDYGSPSHTLPGDNMFTLLQQFLPPPENLRGTLWHGPVENGDVPVRIEGYQPRLLGTTVDEAAWRLMHRVHEAILNARATTLPILQALYAESPDLAREHQTKAATVDAQVLADALHTALSLGTERFDPAASDSLRHVRIGTFFPLEAANLHFPQSEFFSSPHWGFPRSGLILADGSRPLPLKLRRDTGDGEFTDGISAGMGKSLTFLLPSGVYTRFTVLAGLHPELGAGGRVGFTVSGDGKVLAEVTVAGEELARALDVEVIGISRLRLELTGRGMDPKRQYAIWAEPTLHKP